MQLFALAWEVQRKCIKELLLLVYFNFIDFFFLCQLIFMLLAVVFLCVGSNVNLWNFFPYYATYMYIIWGPFICSRYTYPGKCSRNKFSVHKHSDCEHCEMFSVPLRSALKSAHILVCGVWLIMYTLRNVLKNNTRLKQTRSFNVRSPC